MRLSLFFSVFLFFPLLSSAQLKIDEDVKSLFPQLYDDCYTSYDYYFFEQRLDGEGKLPSLFRYKAHKSTFPVGKATYNDSIEFYIVRSIDYKYDDSIKTDSLRYDYLFIVNNNEVIGNPIQIAYFNYSNPHDEERRYFFDWDNNLNTITISYDTIMEIPIQHWDYTAYRLNSSLDLEEIMHGSKNDILYMPETFEQFKLLFTDDFKNDEDIRIGEFKNYFTTDKVYPISAFKYKGNDYFIVRCDYYGCPDFYNSSAEELYFYRDGEFVDSEIISEYIGGEGGAIEQTYKFNNKDTTFIIEIEQDDCCLSTGYQIPFTRNYSYTLNLSEDKIIKGDVHNLVYTSDFFSLGAKFNFESSDYPSEESPYLIWNKNDQEAIESPYEVFVYLTPSKKASYCIQFFSRNNENEEIVDGKCLCNDKDKPLKKLKASSFKSSKNNEIFPFTIKTSKGDLHLKYNGKFE